MDPPVEIVPAQITQVNEIKYFKVSVDRLELFKSARLSVQLMNENKVTVDVKSFLLTGTDYTNWSNNDQYIIDYVLNKLGFTPK